MKKYFTALFLFFLVFFLISITCWFLNDYTLKLKDPYRGMAGAMIAIIITMSIKRLKFNELITFKTF